tara:strand:+ start:433 stop:1848 length:1416 start_codon:yes stop_codon:yes gene_type:complete
MIIINNILKILTSNYSKIALSNLIQQIISILTTIVIIKNIGSNDYSQLVYFIAISSTIVMLSSCWVNPFYLREGSIEYNKTNSVSESLTTIIIAVLILFSTIAILKEVFEENILSSQKYLFLILIFSSSQILIFISKITFRILENINYYGLISIFEKLFFFISILIYFKIKNQYFIENILLIMVSTYFVVSIIFFFYIIKTISFKKANKIFYRDYVKNSFYIFLATIIVYFSSFEYLIIIIANSEIKEIITYMSIGMMITNIAYMPIYWLEQLYNPKINVLFNSEQEHDKKNYYEKIVTPLIYLVFIIQTIVLIVLNFTDILEYLFDKSFKENIAIVTLIIFTCSTKVIDTLFSIPLLSNRKEKEILYFNIVKTIIFIVFLLLRSDVIYLIYIYLVLCLIQNFYYINLSKKIISNYIYKHEFILVLINAISLLSYILNQSSYYILVILLLYSTCFVTIKYKGLYNGLKNMS